MWKLVIPALAVALIGCGGGGGGSATAPNDLSVAVDPVSATVVVPKLIGSYQNEIRSSTVFNSSVADLNGDGLDDVVVSGWATAPSNYVASRSGFVELKILIQQDDGSLIDKTDELIGKTNATIWGSQRILINDYDKDGKLDIAVLGFQDGASAVAAPSVVFWNNGSSFYRHDLPEKVWAHAACTGDFNGDGLPELIAGATGTDQNTIYANRGNRQFVNDRTITQEFISAAGACAVLRDTNNGNVAIVTTNIPAYPFFSGLVKVWDQNQNFVRTAGLLGSEEPGINVGIYHDIINVIPIDVNNDGKVDLILTDNGDYRLLTANGSIRVLINEGDFVFSNQTEKYLPNQIKNGFYNYYWNQINVDGYPAIYLDHSGSVSLWQFKDGAMVKHKEKLLNDLTKGYQYTNIFKTKKGLSLFLIYTQDYPSAKFFSRPIQ